MFRLRLPEIENFPDFEGGDQLVAAATFVTFSF
jgi:hypothetical protein